MPVLESSTEVAPPQGTKSRRRSVLLKTVLSLIWLLALLEIAPRLFFATNLVMHQSVRRALLGNDDSSWRLFWIVAHRQHEEWTGKYSVYHPVRGWAVMPNIRNMTPFGKDKFVNSNSRGLRGSNEYSYSRIPGKQRILVLGDSFTFGTDVSDDETYSHYLQSLLPNTEVLNFGVQGYGQDQALLYLQDEGVKYHPDVVLLGFMFMDTYRNLWNFFAFAKPKFEMTQQGLKLTDVPVPTPDQVLAREPYRSKAWDFAFILDEKIRWSLGIKEKEAMQLTRPILEQIVSTTRSIGATPVFVYMPAYEELDDLSTSTSAHEQYLSAFCKEQGIACMFLRPRFRREALNGLKLESRFHWTPEMHRIAADEIATFMVQQGIVKSGAAAASSGVKQSEPASQFAASRRAEANVQ
jgi:GDSL-like Lipase/Acylhydrolase family